MTVEFLAERFLGLPSGYWLGIGIIIMGIFVAVLKARKRR